MRQRLRGTREPWKQASQPCSRQSAWQDWGKHVAELAANVACLVSFLGGLVPLFWGVASGGGVWATCACMRVCVQACVRVCVRVCVRARVCACVAGWLAGRLACLLACLTRRKKTGSMRACAGSGPLDSSSLANATTPCAGSGPPALQHGVWATCATRRAPHKWNARGELGRRRSRATFCSGPAR